MADRAQYKNPSPQAEDGLMLNIVTPAGLLYSAHCDSVVLPLADDSAREGGGRIGIRKGHAPAQMALAGGSVRAALSGQTLFTFVIKGGFASVRGDIVRVITDSAERE